MVNHHNILIQTDFSGTIDPNRLVALGSLENDNITFPVKLRDALGNVISTNADVNQLEILLRDGDDVLDGSILQQNSQLIVVGNQGDDFIKGGAGADTLFGGQGRDDIFGGEGDDLIFGNLGDDFVLNGGAGNDTIYGGQGDDYIRGGEGNDYLFGDRGNDILHGDGGVDVLIGGEGRDQFVIDMMLETPSNDPNFVDTIVDFTSGEDEILIFGVDPSFIQMSNLTSVGNSSGFVLYDIQKGDIGSGREIAIVFLQDNPGLTTALTVGTDIFVI